MKKNQGSEKGLIDFTKNLHKYAKSGKVNKE